MKNKTSKRSKVFTLEDAARFIIFRELDKMGVKDSYQVASKICAELKAAVAYRSPSI